MKNRLKSGIAVLCALVLLGLNASALAQEYDAQIARTWLEQFAEALMQLSPKNDPVMTADPARAGQYLVEYEFGTVLSGAPSVSCAEDILEIDVRTEQVTDCRGMRVGMPASDVEANLPSASITQLQVIGTQEAGYGWSWAYMGPEGAYGAEYISYGGGDETGAGMKEYTLTYVLDGGFVSAIHMKIADATLAQAQDGFATAEEIAGKQQSGILAGPNSASALEFSGMTVMGAKALGDEVAHLIAFLGEPAEIQTLPGSAGRVLVYDGAAVSLRFDEYTGVEVVRGVSVSSKSIVGPNGLSVGMPLQTAVSLFRCDVQIGAAGGMLYQQDESRGSLSVQDDGGMLLMYVCRVDNGDRAVLEAGIADGNVTYWHLYYLSDMNSAEGGA